MQKCLWLFFGLGERLGIQLLARPRSPVPSGGLSCCHACASRDALPRASALSPCPKCCLHPRGSAVPCPGWGGLVVRVASAWWDGGDVNGSCWALGKGSVGTPGAGTFCKAPVPPPGRRGPLSWLAVLCSARAGRERPPAGTRRGNNLQGAWGRAARGWVAGGGSPGAGQGLGEGSAGAFAAGLGDPAPASAGGARSERAPRADGVLGWMWGWLSDVPQQELGAEVLKPPSPVAMPGASAGLVAGVSHPWAPRSPSPVPWGHSALRGGCGVKDVDAAQPPLGSQSRAGNRSRFPQPCRSGTGLWEGTPGGDGDGERVQGVPPGMEQGCMWGGGAWGGPHPWGLRGRTAGAGIATGMGRGARLWLGGPGVQCLGGGTGGAGEPAVRLGGRACPAAMPV